MSINTTGLFIADTPIGNYIVSASVGTKFGTAPVTITPAASGGTTDGNITITATSTYQAWDGFGISQRMFDDPHINGQSTIASTGGMNVPLAAQNEIMDKLYSPTLGIGLNRFRCHVTQEGWQTVEGGQFVYDAAYPGPQGTKTITLLSQMQSRNTNLQIGMQIGQYDTWVRTTTVAKTAAYIKTATDYIKSYGYEPIWVGVQNEPTGDGVWGGARLRDVGKALKALFDADVQYGNRIKLMQADEITDGASNNSLSVILADSVATSQIMALGVHLYGGTTIPLTKGFGVTYNKPVWMTEYYATDKNDPLGWGILIQSLITEYDCAAVDMLFGFHGIQYPGVSYISITTAADGITYTGYILHPWYYNAGHWSKYLLRGDIRIAASCTQTNVQVSAFTRNTKKTIVLINTATVSYNIGIPNGTYRVIQSAFATGGTDRLADKGLFTTAVSLPATSMTTLIEQ